MTKSTALTNGKDRETARRVRAVVLTATAALAVTAVVATVWSGRAD